MKYERPSYHKAMKAKETAAAADIYMQMNVTMDSLLVSIEGFRKLLIQIRGEEEYDDNAREGFSALKD
jgi:hypothetical protein